jgi:hypothetical protein
MGEHGRPLKVRGALDPPLEAPQVGDDAVTIVQRPKTQHEFIFVTFLSTIAFGLIMAVVFRYLGYL